MEIVFGIFAHPDDETLVAGTLMKKCADGAEINLVVVTDGQAGGNPMTAPDLGQARLEEWQNAARVINAQTTHALHYADGGLATMQLSDIVETLKQLVLAHLATVTHPAQVSFITFDTDGLTGHQDHVTVTNAVTKLRDDIKMHLPSHISVGDMQYYRLSDEQAAAGPSTDEYPLKGYSIDDMDQVINVSEFVMRKKTVMNCHASQRNDMEKWQQLGDELLCMECFRIQSGSTVQES